MGGDSRAVLGPILEEKLESRGLGDEMFEVLMEKEDRMYSRLEEPHEPDMPKDVRYSALFFLKWCIHQVPEDALALTNYINAVQLFDVTAPKSIGNEDTSGPVWAFAAAAWSLTYKMNSSKKQNDDPISDLASLAEVLLGRPTNFAADIRQQEEAIFLKCNVSAPAPSTWCTFFFARLDAILNGILAREGHLGHLHVILSKVLTMAVESVQFSRGSPPYILAVGSFCLALVVAELVPVSEVIDLSMKWTSSKATVETKLAWMTQNFKSQYFACSVPSKAMIAATVVALRSNTQDMKLITTSLVDQLMPPQRQTHSC